MLLIWELVMTSSASRGAIKVRPSKGKRRLKRAVFVKHHARRHEHRPGQMIREPIGIFFVFREA